jgi:predicted RNA-binding Zn-ribbon protein involved in translation (DUF1610 family)
MDLGRGGKFTSDIDILARLYDFPRSKNWVYRTWEVKVSLLCKDGTTRSLKSGKTVKTMKQLRAYREFGSPEVSLLDVCLCETGFMGNNPFPPEPLKKSVSDKREKLKKECFGYQLLTFEHGKDGDFDVGLRVIHNVANPMQTTMNILPALVSEPRRPFSSLATNVNRFFEWSRLFRRPNPFTNQIIFCRNCRKLQLINMRDTYTCPNCRSDLIAQS